MTRISFRVVSIELKDSTLHKINENNLIRLNLTQRPHHISDEYLLKNVHCLYGINHEFNIEDPLNQVERLTLTVRSVLKKSAIASLFDLDDITPTRKPKDHSIDRYVDQNNENRDANVNCDYFEPKHSLIGYCTIDVKALEKGINNTFRVELLTRGNVQVVGFVNLEVYEWQTPVNHALPQASAAQISNQPILFVDPGCPPANTQQAFA